VPALLLFAWWGLASDGLAGGEAWEESVRDRYATLTGAEWEPLIRTLQGVPDRLMSVYADDADERITVAVGLCLLILLLLRRVGQPPAPSRRARLAQSAPELLTLFVALFYVALPTSYKWVWPVNWRFLPVAALLLLSWSRADLGVVSRRVMTVVFTAIALWSVVVHVNRFKAFDAEAAEVHPILDEIEPGGRVLSLVFNSGSKVISGPVYLHFAQYHCLRKGGVAVYSFAEAPQSPVRFRPQRQGGPPPTPLRFEWKPHEFRFNSSARFYDYFLVRAERPGFVRKAGFPRRELKRVKDSGPWRLYKLPRDN